MEDDAAGGGDGNLDLSLGGKTGTGACRIPMG